MLVCVVSQRARRLTLIGDVVEIAAADDASNWFFPQLAAITEAVATAADTVSAFVGQYLLEAASAADTVSATLGTVTNRSLIETVVAADNLSGEVHIPTTLTAAISEAASASAALDWVASDTKVRLLSASRAGTGSMVAGGTGGKTQIIPGIGAVT